MSKITVPIEKAGASVMVNKANLFRHVVFATPSFDMNCSSDHKLSSITTERLGLMSSSLAAAR